MVRADACIYEDKEIDEYGDRFVYDHTQFFMSGNHLDFFEELVILLEKSGVDP